MKYQELGIADRVKLVEDIWESIDADLGALQLTIAQKYELQARLNTFFETGDPGELAKQSIKEIKNKL